MLTLFRGAIRCVAFPVLILSSGAHDLAYVSPHIFLYTCYVGKRSTVKPSIPTSHFSGASGSLSIAYLPLATLMILGDYLSFKASISAD